jgi:hypothetical protein
VWYLTDISVMQMINSYVYICILYCLIYTTANQCSCFFRWFLYSLMVYVCYIQMYNEMRSSCRGYVYPKYPWTLEHHEYEKRLL